MSKPKKYKVKIELKPFWDGPFQMFYCKTSLKVSLLIGLKKVCNQRHTTKNNIGFASNIFFVSYKQNQCNRIYCLKIHCLKIV